MIERCSIDVLRYMKSQTSSHPSKSCVASEYGCLLLFLESLEDVKTVTQSMTSDTTDTAHMHTTMNTQSLKVIRLYYMRCVTWLFVFMHD
jgi:hypothetical protein